MSPSLPNEAVQNASISIMKMFLDASLVVQAVMILLLLASIWCWAIIVDKVIRFKKLRKQADRFEEMFWSGRSIEEVYRKVGTQPQDPMSAIFGAAMREWTLSSQKGSGVKSAGLQARVERVMTLTLTREMDDLEKYMGFLASTGSTAPFVGLFGTVWGIMTSFNAIACSKNTSLAVVAPGIAEALFATALGLVAAIPAVLAYNKLSHELARYGQRLESFVGEFSAILSRQIDEGTL
jgi:biopolymer transport protein TolQ